MKYFVELSSGRDFIMETEGTVYDIAYDEFMSWKIAGWELPSSIACIIREDNRTTGKVTEHVYTSVGHGKRKARALMAKGESEFTVCTRNAVHFMQPEEYDPFDDPLA